MSRLTDGTHAGQTHGILGASVAVMSQGARYTVRPAQMVRAADGYVYWVVSQQAQPLEITAAVAFDYRLDNGAERNIVHTDITLSTATDLQALYASQSDVQHMLVCDASQARVGLFAIQTAYNPANAAMYHYRGTAIDSMLQQYIVDSTDNLPTIPATSMVYWAGLSVSDSQGNPVPIYAAYALPYLSSGKYMAVDVSDTRQYSQMQQHGDKVVVWQADEVVLSLINCTMDDSLTVSADLLDGMINLQLPFALNSARFAWSQSQDIQSETTLKYNVRSCAVTCNYWLQLPRTSGNITSSSVSLTVQRGGDHGTGNINYTTHYRRYHQ